jgi:hypothetical protein
MLKRALSIVVHDCKCIGPLTFLKKKNRRVIKSETKSEGLFHIETAHFRKKYSLLL